VPASDSNSRQNQRSRRSRVRHARPLKPGPRPPSIQIRRDAADVGQEAGTAVRRISMLFPLTLQVCFWSDESRPFRAGSPRPNPLTPPSTRNNHSALPPTTHTSCPLRISPTSPSPKRQTARAKMDCSISTSKGSTSTSKDSGTTFRCWESRAGSRSSSRRSVSA
jgi:hypothetical protein